MDRTGRHARHTPDPTPAPRGRTPWGRIPWGRTPRHQAPYHQASYDQAPEGQAPRGQTPEGQAPYASPPYDRAPRGGRAPYGGQAPYGGAPRGGQPHDPDAGWLARVMHVAFFLLLGASLVRFLIRHEWEDRGLWIVALSVALAALYLLGPVLGSRATPGRIAWLCTVVAVWVVLVVLAPSFAWCAVPLFYTGLRTLPARAALVLVTLLTAFVVFAQVQLSHGGWDPNLIVAPPAVAAIATGVFVHADRQAARQRALIDDLIRTRRELAAIERREGTLAERQRLSMEIHDTLAQGLSSQQMLLQAADRTWDGDPETARRHVRTAESIAERNLAEARRFVHDLAPADLAGGGGLEQALRGLAERESAAFRVDGTPVPLPDRAQSALLRIAQGALANIREHAGATSAALTLTYLDDQVVLDVADDGSGFDPSAARDGGGVRGHGLPAMRVRARQLGGTLTVESTPGEGTVLSAAIPLAPPVEARP